VGVPQRAGQTTPTDRAFRLPPRAPDGRFVAIPTGDAADAELSMPGLYLNRELSWL
jgi:hypothetical protein